MSKEAWRATYRIEDMARILMMTGDYRGAIQKLDSALSVPWEVSMTGLTNDPTWAPLTRLPQFQELSRKYPQ